MSQTQTIGMDDKPTYGPKQIARELMDTALGNAYYGNALYVAVDFPGLSDEERGVLRRYLVGSQAGTDHVELQRIAIEIACSGRDPITAYYEDRAASGNSPLEARP